MKGMISKVDATKKGNPVITIDGTQYYSKTKSVLFVVGKTVEFEFNPTPYNNKVYNWIGIESLKECLNAPNQAPGAKNGHSGDISQPKNGVSETNWPLRNRQTDRGMLISYCKDMVIAGKLEIGDIEKEVEKLFNLQYEKEEEISF